MHFAQQLLINGRNAPCHALQRGSCRFGNKCKFSHDTLAIDRRRSNKPCQNYGRGWCRYGDNCPYEHDGTSALHNTEVSELELWQKALRTRESAGLFSKALQLIDNNHADRQAVIVALATERGVTQIKALLAQDFGSMKDQELQHTFQADLLPLIRTITDQRVIDSGLLERHLDEIFPIVFGTVKQGQRHH